jgi:hypothetical protein
MTATADQKRLEPLDVFVGEWSLATSLAPNPADAPRARTTDDDSDTITGRWESSSDGSDWNHDFDLTYTRLP